MEISYDLIIKYLLPKLELNNTNFVYKSTLPNIMSDSFPTKIKSYLKDYNRYGVNIYDLHNNNISFWSSLLTLLNEQFNVSIDHSDIEFINKFKNDLVDKYSKSKLQFKIDKIDIREQLKLIPNINILQYISDILKYSILIADIKDDKFYIIYNLTYINSNHNILIMSKYDNFWEPIMNHNKKIFNYEDVSHILDNVLYYDNIKEIKLNPENFELEKINKTKLTKMKINEVVELCKQINITLPEKYNKNILINLVLEKI
jgi:hypothetical protein